MQADTAGKFQGGDRFSLDFSDLMSLLVLQPQTSRLHQCNSHNGRANHYSATNSFEAIDGVTINAVSTGTATATVALNTSAMAAKVSTFVSLQ